MWLDKQWGKLKDFHMPFKAVTVQLIKGWSFTAGVSPDLTLYTPVKGVTVFLGCAVIKNQRLSAMERLTQYTLIVLCFKLALAKLYLREEK